MKGFEFINTINGKDINVFNFVYDAEVVKNLISQRCQIIRGELGYNTVLGIGLKSNKDALDLDISSIILETPGVEKITSFTSSLVDKNYTATIEITTNTGEELEVIL